MRRHVLWIGVSVLGAVGVLGALWTVPRLEERPLSVRLDDVVPVRRTLPANTVRFAVAPVFTAEGTAEGYAPVARVLAHAIGRPVRIVQRRTYAEINELVLDGSAQVALVCAGAWLDATHEGHDLRVLAVPSYVDGATYRSITIVRAESRIDSLEDLAGRPFAFSDPLSLSGHYYPLEWALGAERDPRALFRAGTFTYSHTRSIDAVLRGDVDAAAVSSRVWAAELRRRPELRERLRVLHESPPLGANPVVALASLDPALARVLQEALYGMADDAEGRATLAGVGIRRFEPPRPDQYAPDQERFAALMRHMEAAP